MRGGRGGGKRHGTGCCLICNHPCGRECKFESHSCPQTDQMTTPRGDPAANEQMSGVSCRIHLGHFAPFEDPKFFAGRLLAAFAPATPKL